jgi:hypothetical protein
MRGPPRLFLEDAMHVIEILLPLRDNEGTPFPRAALDRVRQELTERFGGVTAHLRAPAAGAWKDDEGDVARDDVVIVEVMADSLDRGWWSGYRRDLEARFRQDEILIRATECERL